MNYNKGQEAYYDDLHKKNLPTLQELAGKMLNGVLKVIDIRVDEPEFGYRRVVIFFHEAKEIKE